MDQDFRRFVEQWVPSRRAKSFGQISRCQCNNGGNQMLVCEIIIIVSFMAGIPLLLVALASL